MTNQVIPIEGIDKGGVNLDSPSVSLPPNTFSDVKNVRFNDGAIRRFLGHLEIFGDTDHSNLLAIEYWETPIGSTYAIAYNKNADTDRVALLTIDNQGETMIIEFENNFQPNGKWQFTTFNGGYTLVVNNGRNNPHHVTTQQGGEFDDLTLEVLPGWASYNNGDTDVNAVSAGIIISSGNSLIAGDLVERDNNGNIARELRGVVRSSDVAAPGTIPQNWNPFQTGVNTADELLLADTGFISALISLQGKVFAFTQDSIHQVEITPTGLRTIPITYQYGALGQGAVFEFDGRMIVVGSNDIYEFSGHPASIQSIADGRVRRYLFDNLNPVHTDIFMVRNLRFDEMWIGYANLSSTTGTANEALVFNYRDNTWTKRDLPDIVSMTSGAIPGGGLAGTAVTLSGTGNTGQFGVCANGDRGEQSLQITDTALARHNGIQQVQTISFDEPDTDYAFDAHEIFDLVISNEAGKSAQPDLVHAVNTITFPAFTPNKNSAIAGGTRLVINGTNPTQVTIDASSLGNFTDLAGYLTEVRDLINDDSVSGMEDYTATLSGNVLTLTSDVMGSRTFTSGSITTYTGNVIEITQNTADNDISLVRTLGSTIIGPNGSGTGNNSNVGGIQVTVTPSSQQVGTPFSGSRFINGDSGQLNLFTAPGDGSVTINRNHNQGGYSIRRNGTQVAQGNGSGSHTFSMSAGDQFTGGGADGNPGSDDPQTWSFSWGGTYNVTSYVITFTNNNSYPVTLNASSTGGARTIPAGSTATVQAAGTSSSQSWVISSSNVQQYIWTATNNRTAAEHPLQENVFDFEATVGSDTLIFGDITSGTSVMRTTTDAATTATWSAGIFGTQANSFNTTTNNAATTEIGTVNITRNVTTLTPSSFVPDTANLVPQDGNADWTVARARSGAFNLATYVQSVNGIQFTNPGHTQPTTTGTYTVAATGDVYFVVVGAGGGGAEWFGAGGSGGGGAGIYGRIPNVAAGTVLNVGAGGAGTGKCSAGGNNGGGDSYITGTGINIRAGGGGGQPGTPENAGPGGLVGDTIGAVVLHSLDGADGVNGSGVPVFPGTPGGQGYFTQRGATDYRFRTGENQGTTFGYANWVHGTDHSWGDGGRGTQCGNSGAPGIVFIWQQVGYSYTATVDENEGPATITSADGTAIDVPLTQTPQTIVSSTSNATINVQGNYTTVSGTATVAGSTTHAIVTAGNGTYGFDDGAAPTIRLRFTHTGAAAFTADVPPFEEDDDTPGEYKEFLLQNIRSVPAFSGNNPDDTDIQPDGAVFYVFQSPDNPDAVRFFNLDTDDHEPISITAYTELNGVEYAEGHFGGGIMEEITTIVEGQVGDDPPVIRYTHPDTGFIDIIYFGTYTSASDIANTTQDGLAVASEFTFTQTGGDVIATKNTSDTDETLFTVDLMGNDEDFLPTITQTTKGELPSNVTDTLVVSSPDFGSFEVPFTNVGDADTTITSVQIAQAIRDEFDLLPDGDLTHNWTIELNPDSDTVIFKSSYDSRDPVTNTNRLPQETLVANTTPGYTGQRLGRPVDSEWSYSVIYGETGTANLNPPTLTPKTWTIDSEGTNPEFSQSGFVYVQFGDLDTTVVKLDNLSIDDAGLAIYNAFRVKDFFEAEYNSTTDIVELIATDYTSALRSQILTVETSSGTYVADCSDSTVVLSDLTTRMNDPDRPWTITSFNTSRQFVVMATESNIYAADLTTTFADSEFEAYVERKRMHMAPTKDVENITGVFIDRFEGDTELTVKIAVSNNPYETVDFDTDTEGFNTYTQPTDDYKTDVRETGRLLSFRIGNISDQDFIIENISLEIGKRGQR